MSGQRIVLWGAYDSRHGGKIAGDGLDCHVELLNTASYCTTNGPMPAPFSPVCHVLCTETRLGALGRTAGPFRMGQAEADTWSAWNPGLAPSAPRIAGGADVDQVWIRNLDEPGKHDVFRGDVVGGDLLYTHQKFDGTWTPAMLLNPTLRFPAPPSFARVSLASVNQELHICGVTGNGDMFHSSRRKNVAGGDPGAEVFSRIFSTDVESVAGERGRFVDVGCAGVLNPTTGQDELHVVGVTDDGRLWHTIASGVGVTLGLFGSWTPFDDVENHIGDLGEFVKVDAAANGGQLHVVGVTRTGRAWHSIRIPAQWRAAEDVVIAVPSPLTNLTPVDDIAIGFCNEGIPPDGPRDVSQLNVVLVMGGKLQHTVRATHPIAWTPLSLPTPWKPFTDLNLAAGFPGGGTLASPSISERPFGP